MATVSPASRSRRRMAAQVEVKLSPIQWTPELAQDVARLLADALVRDFRERPPCHPKIDA